MNFGGYVSSIAWCFDGEREAARAGAGKHKKQYGIGASWIEGRGPVVPGWADQITHKVYLSHVGG